MTTYFSIEYKALTFAVEVMEGGRMTEAFVQEVAPCGKWMKGKPWKKMSLYWMLRGAKIKKLNV
ncbi:MAG: hypothetical protein WKF87_22555 [Chryseolinea sp.]